MKSNAEEAAPEVIRGDTTRWGGASSSDRQTRPSENAFVLKSEVLEFSRALLEPSVERYLFTTGQRLEAADQRITVWGPVPNQAVLICSLIFIKVRILSNVFGSTCLCLGLVPRSVLEFSLGFPRYSKVERWVQDFFIMKF